MTSFDTFGYSGNVGEWSWELSRPRPASPQERNRLLRALASGLFDALGEMHRVHRAEIDVEHARDDGGGDFAEGIDVTAPDGDRALRKLDAAVASFRDGIVTRLDVVLDTTVVLAGGPEWVPESAELYIGAGPLLDADGTTAINVSYSTYIDVWLGRTLGPDRVERDNSALARLNEPRLRDLLTRISAAVGQMQHLSTDSYYYRDQILPQGFPAV